MSLPNGWTLTPVSEVCEAVVDCKNRTPPFVEYSEFAVARTPNVRNGRFVRTDLKFTDADSYAEWTRRAVPKFGDVLITREAPLGEVCLVPSDIKICLGQRMMMYRPNSKLLDSTYLLNALMSPLVQTRLTRKKDGSTVGHAKVGDIRDLPIPVPPLPEQKRIAEILSTWDQAIATSEKLSISLNRFSNYLISRLIRETGTYERVALREIADVNPRSSAKPKDGLVSFLGMADISEKGSIISRQERQYSEVKKGFTGFCENDTLVAKIKPCFENGKGCLATKLKNSIGFGSTEFHVLRPKKGIDPRLPFYISISDDFRKKGQAFMTGSAGQKRVPTEFLEEFLVINRRSNQSTLLEAIDKARALSKQYYELVQAQRLQKQGLMQKLLTGQIRVKV